MFNSGIGPIINKKLSKMNPQQKKPTLSGPMAMMYSSQLMNQNKMGMPPNMNMPNNPMNVMKDHNLAMQQQQQQLPPGHPGAGPGQPNPQHPSMKIENVSLQAANKPGGTHFMVNKGNISSPSPIQTQGTPKDLDPRAPMPNNPAMNIAMQQQLGNLNAMNVSAAAMAAMKMGADKEPQKPFELMTTSLKIGNARIGKDCKIMTKFAPQKKQIVFEIVEIGSPTKGAADDDSKGVNKRRFETKFSDIEKIDVLTEPNAIRIEAKEKPTEFKEHNNSTKKSSQWVKESTYDTESEIGEDESRPGVTVILAHFKDNLVKVPPGKPSHVEKLKRCELPLFLDGKPVENIQTPLLKGLPFPNSLGRNDSLPALDLSAQLHSSSGFGGPKLGDLNLQTQNSLSLSRRESIAVPMDLNPFNKDANAAAGGAEKMPEEEPQNEAEEDDEDKDFPLLTKEKKMEVKKFEAQLKSMKEEDKVSLIMETIKPKRFGINPASKKIFKCPIYKCQFNKPSVALLKTHMTQKHPKMLNMGFKVDENGCFAWNSELVDFSLMVAKIYPKFVKNIIKEAKKGA